MRGLVWWTDLRGVDPQPSWLTPVEAARADAFLDQLACLRFLARRTWLRQVLAAAVGANPASLVLENPGGRPLLCGGPVLSTASSGDLAVLALGGRCGPLGVDVEVRPRWPAAATALGLASASAAARRWLRIEALAKAEGGGLAASLDSLAARSARPLARIASTTLAFSEFALAGARIAVVAPAAWRWALRRWPGAPGWR